MVNLLLGGWISLCARIGADDTAAATAVGADLLQRWSEPQRHYHDLRHLKHVLSTVDSLGGSDLARLGAWWHDAVYQPREIENEARSAHLAERRLHALGLGHDLMHEVGRLVRLTEAHDPGESDVDGQVLCDADLSVLGWSAEDYERYAKAVRAEYAHLGDGEWKVGRAALLHRLLERSRLFWTPGGSSWEAAARDNLTRELASLRGDLSPDAVPPR